MLIAGGQQKASEPSDSAAPADAFAAHLFPLISDLKYQAPMVYRIPDLPVFTFSLAVVGILLVCSGLFGTLAQSPVPTAGLLVLALALPSYIIEKLLIRNALRQHQAGQREVVQEIKSLREEVSSYLTTLDRRTTRYFHCVTNSKVTTYFILRQIENAIAEMVVELERVMSRVSQESLLKVQERLRGTLEYRDGFAFTSGRVLYTPVHLLPSRLQELVHDLERGILALESEIETFREQAQGVPEAASVESEKQLDLPLGSDRDPDEVG